MNIYTNVDDAYKDLLQYILDQGYRKPNRTLGMETLGVFGYSYAVDISESLPLLTLKKLSGGFFHSIIAELCWFLSGEHHIQNLRKETGIWDEWADENGLLSFAYGRFWRRFPVPNLEDRLPGEGWVLGDMDSMQKFVREESYETSQGTKYRLVCDQIAYIQDMLKTNPWSRRMVLTAHHPANAMIANPPACHIMSIFNVEPDEAGNPTILNCHLHMRSNDVGLGHPFNVTQYAILTKLLARDAGMIPGKLIYTGSDVHLYVSDAESLKCYDQLAYAKEMLSRNPYNSPKLFIADKPLEELTPKDFELRDYQCHPHYRMKVVP